jgi:hypothetical protein
MLMRKLRRLPTRVPVPVDPEFVQKFCETGWQRVERIYGKRRVQVWADALGRRALIAKRREYRKSKRAVNVAQCGE